MTIRVEGDKRLLRKLKKLENPRKNFDPQIKTVATNGFRELVKKTNRDSGDTGRAWKIQKLGESVYSVFNDKKSSDRKHLIVNILNHGRKEVRPVKAKRLYIPLSETGKSKRLGAPIPKGFVYGQDYILAKRSKAFKGTRFIDKIIKDSGKQITKSIIAKLRSL